MKPLKANFILGKKQIVLASLVLILGAAVYLNWKFASNNNDFEATDTIGEAQTMQDLDNQITNPDDIVVDETAAGVNVELANVKEETEEKSEEEAKGTEDDKSKEDVKGTEDDKSKQEAKGTEEDKSKQDSKGAKDTKDAKDNSASKTKNLGDTLLVSSKSIADETYFAMAKMARTRSRDEAIETISTVLNDDNLTDDDKKQVSAKAVSITDVIEAESRIENLIKAKGFDECVVYITASSANVVVKTDGLDQDRATQIKNIIVSEGKIKGENVSITEIN